MKRILWMSKIRPIDRQIDALREMHGRDAAVEQESRTLFDDAHAVAARYLAGRFDDMVIVAQPSVIATLCKGGDIKMLWSEMTEEKDPAKIEFRSTQGQGYRFVRFRRIKQVKGEKLEFED